MTGAAILVALVVLLVPELLSGRRHAMQQVQATSEPPVRSYTLPLTDGAAGGAEPAGVSGAVPWAAGAEPVAAGAEPVAAGAAGAVASPAPTASTRHAAEQDASPAAGADRAGMHADRAAADVDRRAPPPVAAHAAISLPDGKSAQRESAQRVSAEAPAPRAPSRRGWIVQVGSFASRANADRLAHDLKRKGYGAFVSETSSHGRKWYRVRVGPAPDRAAAVAVAKRLRTAGHGGEVLPPL
ncbi:MAG: SPOR domain-containing protein [Steroidobacteraceae bacterium]